MPGLNTDLPAEAFPGATVCRWLPISFHPEYHREAISRNIIVPGLSKVLLKPSVVHGKRMVERDEFVTSPRLALLLPLRPALMIRFLEEESLF